MIPLFVTRIPSAVDAALLEVLHSGQLTQGPKVVAFEKQLGLFLGEPNILTLNSATSAITLALRLAGVGAGDQVITTPMTCAATAVPIMNFGADIVWADIHSSGLIDPADVDRKLTPKTKAIIVVDWGGARCDMGGSLVIEDAAHAFGAGRIASKPRFICYSFQAIKHLTTVDGGALVCDDADDYRQGKLLRWYGIDREAPRHDFRVELDIEDWGYKFHMNDVAATIGLASLPSIGAVLTAHRRNAQFYGQKLSRYFTRRPFDAKSAYWLYTILLPSESARLRFMRHMADRGIQVSQVHARLDTKTVFARFKGEPLPGVDDFAARQVSIPVHWKLSAQERQTVLAACNEFAAEAT